MHGCITVGLLLCIAAMLSAPLDEVAQIVDELRYVVVVVAIPIALRNRDMDRIMVDRNVGCTEEE